jgi:hypothetical protein
MVARFACRASGIGPAPGGTPRWEVRMPELREVDREANRRAELEHARQAVEALKSSTGWTCWLGSRRHFHRYSFANQLLIALHKPEATRVAGFRTWLSADLPSRGPAGRGTDPRSPAREACDHRAGVGPARRPWIGATAQVVIATTRNGFAAGRHLYLRRCRSGDLNATRACGRRLGSKSGRLSISQRS